MTSKQQEKSAFLLSLASYVGGIREGWRRMRGESTKRPAADAKVLRVPERRAGVVRGEAGVREVATHLGQYRVKGSQTSFERFLCSLPRADTVDSTVDWVLAQPDNIEERESDKFANLLPSQRLLRKTQRGAPPHFSLKETEHGSIESHGDELSRVSWSRYESERGTVGRGTPPVERQDRPRLDLLLQHIHKHQERRALAEMKPQRQPYYHTSANQPQYPRKIGGTTENKPVDIISPLSQHRLRDTAENQEVHKSTAQHRTGLHYSNRLSNTHATGRRAANPKMTMVTGLQIRPALVTRKDGPTKK